MIPLVTAIPTLLSGAGGAGLSGALGTVGATVTGLFSGIFGKKGGSGAGSSSLTQLQNQINAQNITAVNTFKDIYAKAQTKSFIVYAVLGLIAVGSLIYAITKK